MYWDLNWDALSLYINLWKWPLHNTTSPTYECRIPAFLSTSFKISPAAAKSLQSCPTLCDPIDRSPPGSPVPGILQARTLEWVAISFSNAWKWKVKVKSLSRVQLSATPWTAADQALRPWEFPGKSTGVGCHCLFQKSLSIKLNWSPAQTLKLFLAQILNHNES